MEMTYLNPQERIKKLASYSESVEIDPNVPPRRYYRSGLEMVRMANVYFDEGSLENAYVLYLKFMTLFIEKIRKHPEFASVPESVKTNNSSKLREVLPKAEKLKSRILEQYRREYDQYREHEKLKERTEKEIQIRLQKDRDEKERKLLKQKLKEQQDRYDKNEAYMAVLPSPPLDNIQYPNTDIDKPTSPSERLKLEPVIIPKAEYLEPVPSVPSFDRGTKPTSLLSPSGLTKALPLRTVVVPGGLMPNFLRIANRNTNHNIETCGILAGKLERDHLIITHMIIPKQEGTADSCVTMNEEEIFEIQDQLNLITLGWIHTHPSQTAFLSSVDLHTHYSYQTMMPEAIAIVCAPKFKQTAFYTLTPDYGVEFIASCRESGFHPHPADPELFKETEHTKIDNNVKIEVIDLRNSM